MVCVYTHSMYGRIAVSLPVWPHIIFIMAPMRICNIMHCFSVIVFLSSSWQILNFSLTSNIMTSCHCNPPRVTCAVYHCMCHKLRRVSVFYPCYSSHMSPKFSWFLRADLLSAKVMGLLRQLLCFAHITGGVSWVTPNAFYISLCRCITQHCTNLKGKLFQFKQKANLQSINLDHQI